MAEGERMRGVPMAFAGGLWATDLAEVSTDLACLDGSGRWFVVLPFSGAPVCLRFTTWSPHPPQQAIGRFRGPGADAWQSSCDERGYVRAVERARAAIAAGDVYQVNVCRILSAVLPDSSAADIAALSILLARGNPAPHAAMVRVADLDLAIASASPELFLRRDRAQVCTGPIKGTAATSAGFLDKDRAENVMIVDLMRNDLARVCTAGSVRVPHLLEAQEHPGLVHLVSTVCGELQPGVGWEHLLAATFPPGSVTGAPKIAALSLIAGVESAPRDVYCGALGWVDAQSGTGSLGVAIRTFWQRADRLLFGSGAGITWSSDPLGEWHETELKAARLLRVAAGTYGDAP